MEGWGPVLKECGLPTPANSRLSKHGRENKSRAAITHTGHAYRSGIVGIPLRSLLQVPPTAHATQTLHFLTIRLLTCTQSTTPLVKEGTAQDLDAR